MVRSIASHGCGRCPRKEEGDLDDVRRCACFESWPSIMELKNWNLETKSRMEDEMTAGCAQTLGDESLQFGSGGWNRQYYCTVKPLCWSLEMEMRSNLMPCVVRQRGPALILWETVGPCLVSFWMWWRAELPPKEQQKYGQQPGPRPPD